MSAYVIRNPEYERDLREGFARQSLMSSIGARLEKVAPGEVDIALDSRADGENETLVATMLGTMMTRSR